MSSTTRCCESADSALAIKSRLIAFRKEFISEVWDKKKNSHSAIPNGSKSRYALSARAEPPGVPSTLLSE
jgi:hypothetical protein